MLISLLLQPNIENDAGLLADYQHNFADALRTLPHLSVGIVLSPSFVFFISVSLCPLMVLPLHFVKQMPGLDVNVRFTEYARPIPSPFFYIFANS